VSAPGAFNIETAAKDFAGPGRKVECPVKAPGEDQAIECCGLPPRRQMKLSVNGWTFSAIWGYGTYCTAARSESAHRDPSPTSPDAEIAVWRDNGGMIDLHGDSVEGWVSPASFLEAVEAAERDDEDAIRAALVRRAA